MLNINIEIKGLDQLTESLALIGSALAYKNGMIDTSHEAVNVLLNVTDKVEDIKTDVEKEIKKEVVKNVVKEVVREELEEPKENINEEVKPDITIEDIRALFVEKNSDRNNTPKLKEILTKFNVKKVTDLEEKDFETVVEELRAL